MSRATRRKCAVYFVVDRGTGATIPGQERNTGAAPRRDVRTLNPNPLEAPRAVTIPVVVPWDEETPGAATQNRVDLSVQPAFGLAPVGGLRFGQPPRIDVVPQENHEALFRRLADLPSERRQNRLPLWVGGACVTNEEEARLDLVRRRTPERTKVVLAKPPRTPSRRFRPAGLGLKVTRRFDPHPRTVGGPAGCESACPS